MYQYNMNKASSGIRTRDLYLTKVTLYQAELSKRGIIQLKILITLLFCKVKKGAGKKR